MKLFIEHDGQMEIMFGDTVCQCIGKLLLAINDDSELSNLIADFNIFLQDSDENEKHAKEFGMSGDYGTIRMCYGYENFFDAFPSEE